MKILRLTSSFSEAASITRSQWPSLSRVGSDEDALEDRLALGFVHLPPRHLARKVAIDGGERGVDALLGDVVEGDVQSRLSRDLGDAGAHLPGADDADRLYVECHIFVRKRPGPGPGS